jgi:hypothetical protein
MTDVELLPTPPPAPPVEDAFGEEMQVASLPDGVTADVIGKLSHPDPTVSAKAKRSPTQAEEI